MSIIERIFVPNSTTFEERRSTLIVSLQPAMLLRRHSLPSFWKSAPRELFIPAFDVPAEPVSRAFGRYW